MAWRAAGRECDLAGRRPTGEISPACVFADPRLWSPWSSGSQNLIPTRVTYPAPPRPAGRGRAARPSRRQRLNAAAREPRPVWHPARERETHREPKLEPAGRHFEWNEALEPSKGRGAGGALGRGGEGVPVPSAALCGGPWHPHTRTPWRGAPGLRRGEGGRAVRCGTAGRTKADARDSRGPTPKTPGGPRALSAPWQLLELAFAGQGKAP